ncbi:MAG: adenylate kinase [Ruminococcaceae bacterium]|nr:adenylate kinase [Oscillospiraceae bacterium]
MKLTIMGPPGGGKGTQAEILSEKLGIPHISTGAIIRNAIREKTELGKVAEGYIADGQLVPDELVIDMVSKRLSEADCENGYILDGFPRTLPQAQAMDKIGIKLDFALNLIVPDEVIVDRLGGRRECKVCAAPYHVKFNPPEKDGVCDKCGGVLITRADDVPETILQRLSVYHKQTEPLIGFYKEKGLLADAVGRDSIEDTTKVVLEVLGVKG